MANPLQLSVNESSQQLRALQRKHTELIAKRMLMLLVIKEHEKSGGISKRDLSLKTGINHNSIVKWRRMYLNGGIDALLVHGRIGFKKSLITAEEHTALEQKLNDPLNGIRGYVELLEWVHSELSKEMKYITLVKYVERYFGTKIKVARKSHIKKDEAAVEAFKKTSEENALKQSLKQTKSSKA
jgi:transposase